MKKTLLMSLLMTCVTAMAQEVNYQYVAPKTIFFLTPKVEKAYVYKSPSLSSPKLYFGCIEDGYDCSYMWSDSLQNEYEPEIISYAKDDSKLLSIEEVGDFYKIVEGSSTGGRIGYVSNTEVTYAIEEPLTLDDIRTEPEAYMLIEEGPCKGLVVKHWSDEAWGQADLLVGSIVSGVLVFSHRVIGRMHYESDREDFVMVPDEGFINIYFGPKQATQTQSEMYVLDPERWKRTIWSPC